MISAPTPGPHEAPVEGIRKTLRHLHAGRLADAVLAGALLGLFFALVIGQLKADVVGALASLSMIVVLFLLAGYDLFVRWEVIDLQRPDRRSAGRQRIWRRLLGSVWPEVVLLAGILAGHLLWKG